MKLLAELFIVMAIVSYIENFASINGKNRMENL